jgi:hypothetical protein
MVNSASTTRQLLINNRLARLAANRFAVLENGALSVTLVHMNADMEAKQKPGPGMRVVIRCPPDEDTPGQCCPRLIVGNTTIKFRKAPRGSGAGARGRTVGVFDDKQPPSWQSYTLLLWLVERRGKSYELNNLPLERAKRLLGWEDISTQAVLTERLKKIIGDSQVLVYEGQRAWIHPDAAIEVDVSPEDKEKMRRWARLPDTGRDDPAAIDARPAAEPASPGASGDDAGAGAPGTDPASAELFGAVVALLVERDDRAGGARLSELALEILRNAPGAARGDLSGGASPAHGAPAEEVAQRIARALVTARLARVVKLFADIVDHEPPQRAVDDAARRLVRYLLPISEQMQGAVATVRAAGPDEPVELDLATRTWAEAVLAGSAPRPCEWSPHGTEPEGLRHVRLPTPAHAAFFDANAERVKEGVLANLLRKPRPDEAPVPGYHELWEKIAKDNPEEQDRRDVAAAYIKAGGRYLLVIDRELGKRSAEDVTRAWNAIASKVGEVFPGLRFVRLKGDREARQKEYDVVTHVACVRDGKRL